MDKVIEKEPPALIVESVSKSYGGAAAVEGVSFAVRRGETVGIVGPNGAGKSTLLKMLSTYILPDAGKMSVMGGDVVARPLEARRNIGYLAGDSPAYRDMRVDRFLLFVGRARGLEAEVLRAGFERVVADLALGDVLLKRLRDCSTGFRQRVGLAAAIIHDPPVLLLDEPAHGLDPLQVFRFREYVRGLKDRRAILFSDHIVQDVAEVCDRVLVLCRGRLLASGGIDELTRQAGEPHATLERAFAALVLKSGYEQ